VIIDIATLTGAQMIATGRRTAAIVSNDGALEAEAVAAGLRSGDLVHPLPYQPELLSAEFASPVADMRNSVKDRNNAQSSCAAQFIASHLGEFRGGWLHVDMAGPAVSGGVGTGFGVGLLLAHLGAA
jgi:probable aminopeptidase NPEPL1